MKIYRLSLLAALLAIFSGCGKSDSSQKTDMSADPRLAQYLEAFTTGSISRQDKITVRFMPGISLPNDLSGIVSSQPVLKGSIVKTDDRTIVFSPAEPLASGRVLTFHLKLDKIIPDIPADLKELIWEVKVIEQDFQLLVGEVQTPDPSVPEAVEFTGTLQTADFVADADAEKMIAIDGGLQVTWNHLSGVHRRFAVTGIRRGESMQTITVRANGSPIGLTKTQENTVQIPGSGTFSVISARAELGEDRHVAVYFSDPLRAGQDLSGLIQLEDADKLRTVIEGNQVKLYFSKKMSGSKKLEISEGVENAAGKKLGANFTVYVAFEPEKPAVRLVGNGSILPSTQGLVLPFEAVNLKTVQVEVVKVYEKNLPQFLQVNPLNGDEQMKRVGQKIHYQTVSLEGKAEDLTRWNRFTLDLASLISAEKGALYQIRLGFSPANSAFPCDVTLTENFEDEPSRWSIHQSDGFDSWSSVWDYRYPEGYEWDERDNPCHVSYYTSSRFVTTSLLATDIGLIAKIGGDNVLNVFTTNMLNAQPVQANIRVLDFQLQLLGEATTNSAGQATVRPARRPFLIIAESQGQKSYLRLNDNLSLSTSNFDVSGQHVEGNLKGLIYGERGAWRPGDDIFLSFMMEDPENKIPADHPVVMELRDPQGNLKDRQIATQGLNGLYAFKTRTATEDLTGNWWANVSVGGNTFSKTLKVETIKPNRLKINLDFGGESIPWNERSLSGALNVKWLTGMTSGNLKAETELRLSQTDTRFDGFDQYEFDDQGKNFSADPDQVFSGQLDQDGNATVNLQLPSKPNSPGALRATFSTKAFEPGGGFSINTKSVTYYPYESFVGVNVPTAENGHRIQRDAPQRLEVVTVDASGKPVNRQNLEFKLYRLNWRWWWDQADDYSTNYLSSYYATVVDSRTFSTTSGKGSVSFQINSPDWGRFIAVVTDPASGHSSSKVLYTSWYGDSGSSALGATSMEVSTDKTEYQTGEKIKLTLKGSKEGQALVSLENGSSLLQSFWVKTVNDLTSVEIPVTGNMAPNVYIHVTLLQPHGQTTNDLPIRLYGLASVKVVDPATRLEPVIRMAAELAPNSPAEITISEKTGKPMTYTLAVVDEGLLDITSFKTPQPWDHFYSKEALGVKTWDIYDEVIGAYGGRLERLLAIGGDEGALAEKAKQEDNRFRPVVQFMGPFVLESGKTKTHTFNMPQYIGSVRTMVVAGMNEAYGSAEKATPVVKPLMVLATLPRVVGPGEKITVPINVFRYKDKIRSADVKVTASGVLQLSGKGSQSIRLDEASGTLYFDLKVADQLGIGKLTVTATSGGESAIHDITIESRSPNTRQTQVKMIPVKAGSEISEAISLFGLEGTNDITLELAVIPPVNMERRLGYLIQYPHGCIEQTVSGAFPQLYLDKVVELSEAQRIKTETNIREAISRIGKFQYTGGGLSYWPGGNYTSSWGTTYAYHFLIEAQKLGYMVPKELMERLRAYQQNKARNWTASVDYSDSDLIQSYRLFTLALGGYPETGAMNRLRSTSGKSAQSLYRLAATYALTGQKEAARELIAQAGKVPVQDRPHYFYYTYSSPERDMAMLLETYLYTTNTTEAFQLVQQLSDKLSSSEWMSTQTTAYALLAIGKYVVQNQSADGLKAELAYGNTKTTVESKAAILQQKIPATTGQTVKIKNTGKGTFFASIITSGIPKAGAEPIGQSGLTLQVSYLDQSGRTLRPDSLPMGQSFDIVISVKNENSLTEVRDIALTHILPSGWEIQNDRLTDQQRSGGIDLFDYQDIRDDRVYTYFSLGRSQTKTFRLTATAAYPGQYYLPGVHAEAMYKASISAKDAGKWVTVKQ